MKRLIILKALILFTLSIQAQAIEVYSNWIYSTVDRHRIDNDPPNFTDYGFLTYNLGVNYHFNRKKKLNYVLGIAYDKKGKDTAYRLLDKYVISRYNFLVIKGLVNLKLPKNEFQIGMYSGFLTDISITPYDDFAKDRIEYMNRYDIGITGIAHQQLFNKNGLQGFFRLEANYDLTSLWDAYSLFSFTGFERAVTLGVGLALRWNYKEQE